MACQSLGQLLERLEAAGQLRRVAAEVAAEREVAEITRRVCHGGGPAVLFENLRGNQHRLVTNLFGSQRRICLALDEDDLSAVGRRLAGEEQSSSSSFLKRWKTALQAGADDPLAPRPVKTAACQQVVRPGRDVDLLGLPAPEFIERKQNRCLAGCTVVTSDLAGGQRHVTAADLVVRDRKTFGIRWLPSQAIAQDYRTFQQAGEKMPVAVLLGGPATVALAAHAEIPGECDGLVFAGLLAGAPIEVATCRALALQVPAEAEIVLEGHVDPEETPFVVEDIPNACGMFEPRGQFHAIDVVVGTGRAEAVVPAMIHVKPPNEKLHIDRALARIFLPIWQQAIPELVDFHYPDFAAEGLAVASFRKTFPFQSRQVASALWGQAATMSTRMLVLVDEQIDVRDDREVWFRVSANVDPQQDVFFREGPGIAGPGGSEQFVRSSRMALDATTKLPDERGGYAPAEMSADAETEQRVDERWSEYGIE